MLDPVVCVLHPHADKAGEGGIKVVRRLLVSGQTTSNLPELKIATVTQCTLIKQTSVCDLLLGVLLDFPPVPVTQDISDRVPIVLLVAAHTGIVS